MKERMNERKIKILHFKDLGNEMENDLKFDADLERRRRLSSLFFKLGTETEYTRESRLFLPPKKKKKKKGLNLDRKNKEQLTSKRRNESKKEIKKSTIIKLKERKKERKKEG